MGTLQQRVKDSSAIVLTHGVEKGAEKPAGWRSNSHNVTSTPPRRLREQAPDDERTTNSQKLYGRGKGKTSTLAAALRVSNIAMMQEESISVSATDSALEVERDQDLRVPCYCEENVWRLAYRKIQARPNEQDCYFVAFISNSIKTVPMFFQRAASSPETSVCWDYHVILLYAHPTERDVYVYDIDSVLDYPCTLAEYLRRSFPYEAPFVMAPLFRVVPAALFLQHFSSDRMHMFNTKTKSWIATPPSYSIIRGHGESNLKHYLNFTPQHQTHQSEGTAPIYGHVMTLPQLSSHDFFSAS